MYAEFFRKGTMDLTKTYTAAIVVNDASSVHWDQSDNNNMNDYCSTVTTQAGTWLWIFANTNCDTNGNKILVQPGQTNYNLQDNGFDDKVGSFQVCDSDPTVVVTDPSPIANYCAYQTLSTPPLANTRYMLFVQNSYTSMNLQPLTYLNNALTLDSAVYSSVTPPTTTTVATGLSLAYQWQFFEVSDGNFVIANCENGKLLYKSNTNTGNGISMTLSANTDNCGIYALTQYQETNGGWTEAVAMRDVTGSGDAFLTVGAPANNSCVWESGGDYHMSCQWFLLPYETFDLPDYTPNINRSLPAFNNGTAPPRYPLQPELSNKVYVPYFMVNDSAMKNWGDRIQHSPYYLLNQYWQFKLAASVINDTDGQVLFNESWTYGWSVNLSAMVSASLGFALGDKFEVNAIVVKDTIEGGLNIKLGISATVGVTGSGTYSKNLSIYAQPNSCVALYGVETTYELYQMNGTNPVAKPNVPMRMDNNFLTITGAIPTNSTGAGAS